MAGKSGKTMHNAQQQQQLQTLYQRLQQTPENPQLHADIAQLLIRMKEYGAAVPHFERLLSPATPPDQWLHFASTCESAGLRYKALQALHRAMTLTQGRRDISERFARLAMTCGDNRGAVQALIPHLQRSPDDESLVLLLTEAYHNGGETQASVNLLQQALQRMPKKEQLWLALALAYEDLGDKDAAAHAFQQAINLKPGWPFAIASAVSFARKNAPDAWLSAARKFAQKKNLNSEDSANLHFALARTEQSLGHHDEAFVQVRQANRARRREAGPLNREAQARRADKLISEFTAERINALKSMGNTDARPTLVVGLPRSGTSLIEQVLASHPQVEGCGELPDLPNITRWLAEMLGAAWPETSRHLNPQAMKQAAGLYLATLGRFSQKDTLRCIDKTPANFFHCGIFQALFPNGRVIWMRRDLRDVALSIYFENFSHTQRYATDLADIAHYALAQKRMMEHWAATSAVNVLEVHYEELVADFEPQARRVTGFMELDWNEAALNFHKTERAVTTPSRWQVRQPIYTGSVARWKPYEKQMQPLFAEMEKLGL